MKDRKLLLRLLSQLVERPPPEHRTTAEGLRYHTGGGRVGHVSKIKLPVSRQWLQQHPGREVEPPAGGAKTRAATTKRARRAKASGGGGHRR